MANYISNLAAVKREPDELLEEKNRWQRYAEKVESELLKTTRDLDSALCGKHDDCKLPLFPLFQLQEVAYQLDNLLAWTWREHPVTEEEFTCLVDWCVRNNPAAEGGEEQEKMIGAALSKMDVPTLESEKAALVLELAGATRVRDGLLRQIEFACLYMDEWHRFDNKVKEMASLSIDCKELASKVARIERQLTSMLERKPKCNLQKQCFPQDCNEGVVIL